MSATISGQICHHCGAVNDINDALCFSCQNPLSIKINENDKAILLKERYRVVSLLGTGGFSSVYKALDTHTYDQPVAIKKITLTNLTAQEMIDATDTFNREALLLASLHHPQLPCLHERFHDPEHWYLVMDYLEGETLEAYISKIASKQLAIKEVLDIALQLCTVLTYLHQLEPPIIFRDLKPSNIMRSPQGQLSLLDFGIARYFKPGKTKDTIPLGSPGFAAPEQYGKSQTTAKADIYSLGALLHMLLSGNDPSESPFHFPALQLYGATGIRNLEDLIQRMVSLHPQDRPDSIAEVVAELQPIQQLQQGGDYNRIWTPPVGQTPDTIVNTGTQQQQQLYWSTTTQQQTQQQKPTKKVSRRAMLAGALAFGGTFYFGFSQINRLTDALQTVQYNKEKQPEYLWSAWSPDLLHRIIAYRESYIYNNANIILQTTVPFNDIRQITSSNVYQANVIWSSLNHAYMLTFADIWEREIYFLHSKEPVKLLPTIQHELHNAVWSHDGKTIALYNNNVLYLASATTGNLLKQYTFPQSTGDQKTILAAAWSQNNQILAVARRKSDTASNFSTLSIDMINVQTSQQHTQTVTFTSPVSPYQSVVMQWATNNKYLSISGGAEVLLVHPAQSVTPIRFVTHLAQDSIQSIHWSPTNKYLALFQKKTIIVWDIAAQKYTIYTSNEDMVTMTWRSNELIGIAIERMENDRNKPYIDYWSVKDVASQAWKEIDN